MIDSHAHIYLEQFDDDRDEMLERAQIQNIVQILMPNIDHTSVDSMLEIEAKYGTYCKSMMGLHPCSVNKNFEKELYNVEYWLGKYSFVAVGEIGIDLYWDKTYFEQQKEAFCIQCEWGLKYDLPVVIHCRESIDETIELVAPFADRGLKGVFHCFTGNEIQARQIIDMGFYLGIGGVATFKNGGLDKVLPNIDHKRLLLETDSPYLAPAPNRGKRNEPSFLPLILTKITEIYNLERSEIEEITTSNTQKLFGLE